MTAGAPPGSGTADGYEPGEFLGALTSAEHDRLAQLGQRRQWPAGELLLVEGGRPDSVVFVLSGRTKVVSLTESGAETVLAVRGPGALIGELSALDGQPRGASVAAMEPVAGLVVPLPAFHGFLLANPRLPLLLLRMLAGRLRDADRKRVEFGGYDTRSRVARRLLELAERYGQPGPHGLRIGMPFTQDDLAGWAGCSREAVGKAMRALRQDGCLATVGRRLVILDPDRLRKEAGT